MRNYLVVAALVILVGGTAYSFSQRNFGLASSVATSDSLNTLRLVVNDLITLATGFSTTTANTFTAAQTFSAGFVNNATSSGSQGIALTGGCFSVNGTCLPMSAAAGTVTSVAGGSGLNGGTITAAGTLSLISYLATSTAETGGQVAIWGSTSGWPAKLYSVATSTPSLGSAFSFSGTLGSFVGGTSGTLSSIQTPSFSFPAGAQVATTTTATTTVALGPAFFAETWNAVACWSGAGNVPYNFTDGTNDMNVLQATTTVSRFTLSSNNSFTVNEKRFIEIGPMTASYISCSISKTI